MATLLRRTEYAAPVMSDGSTTGGGLTLPGGQQRVPFNLEEFLSGLAGGPLGRGKPNPSFKKRVEDYGKQRLDLALEFQPLFKAYLQKGIAQLGSEGTEAAIQKFGKGAAERNMEAARLLSLLMPGSGIAGGAANEAMNRTLAETGQFAAAQQSPEAQFRRTMQILSLIREATGQRDFLDVYEALKEAPRGDSGMWSALGQMGGVLLGLL